MTIRDNVVTVGLSRAAERMPLLTTVDAVRSVLIAVLASLLGIGAVMVYSTMARGDGPLVSIAFIRQILYMILGVCAACILGRIDYRILIRHHRLILLAALIMLAVVLIPSVGARVNGARRWFRLGSFSFQPTEMAKFAIVIFLAGFLANRMDRIRSFTQTLLPAAAVIGITCLFVILEPDIGTTVLIGSVCWILLFAAGSNLFYLLGPVAVAIPALYYVVRHSDYAWTRIMIWLDPSIDPKGAGYHIIQSLIAVGSGGIRGVGLGSSSQKLLFLPESSSDFIFAILAEELGLAGVTLVIFLYAAFILCGITIARRASDPAGSLLALGITSIVAIQAIINICVVTQVFPTKGIALPFISAGGSAAIFMIAGTGILYSIARHREPSSSDSKV